MFGVGRGVFDDLAAREMAQRAYRWETPASVWLEDDSSGQFELVASEGLGRIDWSAHARGRMADFAHLLGASLPGCEGEGCEHSPIYPEGFAFCPECGQPLARLAGPRQRAPEWCMPTSCCRATCRMVCR
jgi:hypothetical protein